MSPLEISNIMGVARFMKMKRAAVTLLTKFPDKNRDMLVEMLKNGVDVQDSGGKTRAVAVEHLPLSILARMVSQVVDDAQLEEENAPEAPAFIQAYQEIMGEVDANFRLSPAGMAFRGRVRSFWQYQEAVICEQIQKLIHDPAFVSGVALRSCANKEPGLTSDVVNETLRSLLEELRKTMTPDEVVLAPRPATPQSLSDMATAVQFNIPPKKSEGMVLTDEQLVFAPFLPKKGGDVATMGLSDLTFQEIADSLKPGARVHEYFSSLAGRAMFETRLVKGDGSITGKIGVRPLTHDEVTQICRAENQVEAICMITGTPYTKAVDLPPPAKLDSVVLGSGATTFDPNRGYTMGVDQGVAAFQADPTKEEKP